MILCSQLYSQTVALLYPLYSKCPFATRRQPNGVTKSDIHIYDYDLVKVALASSFTHTKDCVGTASAGNLDKELNKVFIERN